MTTPTTTSDSITINMSNYPDFDAQWRECDADAQAAEEELKNLFTKIKGEKGERI